MSLLLEDVKLSFCGWLKLKDHTVVDVILGTVVANDLPGDPVNLYTVGPPSTGKTEILRSLNDHPKIYYTSNLTPQTLVSGSKSKDGKFKSSLLLNLKQSGKTILVLKDFTTVLEMRSESRQEILSQLREIADGYYRKTFGTGDEITWSGKLAIIAGVTPAIERYHSIHQVLGERFLYFRISPGDPRAMAEMARKWAGKEEKMRHELRETVKQFLAQFEKPGDGNIPISEDLNQKLFSLACFVAEARSGVSRDRYTQAIEYLPEAEGPARLVKQLWTLGAGISIIQGKSEFDDDVYNILKKVGKDTLPSHRNLILKKMWEKDIAGNSWEKTRTLSGFFNYPTTTTKLQLEDLMVLNLLDRKFEDSSSQDDDVYGYRKSETTPYCWRLSDHCCELIRTSEIYDTGDDSWDFNLDEAEDLNKQSPGVAVGA
jgi:hypothetical protein